MPELDRNPDPARQSSQEELEPGIVAGVRGCQLDEEHAAGFAELVL